MVLNLIPEMTPQKDTEPMAQRSIRLPQQQMDLISELAAEDGIEVSAVIRDLIRAGLPSYLAERSAMLEYQNKKLVNQKLLRALEDANG